MEQATHHRCRAEVTGRRRAHKHRQTTTATQGSRAREASHGHAARTHQQVGLQTHLLERLHLDVVVGANFALRIELCGAKHTGTQHFTPSLDSSRAMQPRRGAGAAATRAEQDNNRQSAAHVPMPAAAAVSDMIVWFVVWGALKTRESNEKDPMLAIPVRNSENALAWESCAEGAQFLSSLGWQHGSKWCTVQEIVTPSCQNSHGCGAGQRAS